MKYNFAIQHKASGQLIDYCETKEQVKQWLSNYPVECIDLNNASKLSVWCTELGGPYGYGHQEESFCTYGSLKKCIRNLYKWMQQTTRTFGPDARDIKDFFRHCSLTINGEDKTSWILKQVEGLSNKTIYA